MLWTFAPRFHRFTSPSRGVGYCHTKDLETGEFGVEKLVVVTPTGEFGVEKLVVFTPTGEFRFEKLVVFTPTGEFGLRSWWYLHQLVDDGQSARRFESVG